MDLAQQRTVMISLKHLNRVKSHRQYYYLRFLNTNSPDITSGQKSVTRPFLSQSPYRVGSGPLWWQKMWKFFSKSSLNPKAKIPPWSSNLSSLWVDTSWVLGQRVLGLTEYHGRAMNKVLSLTFSWAGWTLGCSSNFPIGVFFLSISACFSARPQAAPSSGSLA